jgi:putative hydrolase of the HAD superfamily
VPLAHVINWVFDLDNTLYPMESPIGDRVDKRITEHVMRVTGLARPEAYRVQKEYLARYGGTMRGLELHHGADPRDYHAIFHDMPLDGIAPHPELNAAIRALPGRKFIFTNADRVHAERVSERIGLAGVFDGVFDIADAEFVPKPAQSTYEAMFAAHDVSPVDAAFFEDSARNLEPAAAFGLTTVLVGPHALENTDAFVHHRSPSLAAFFDVHDR